MATKLQSLLNFILVFIILIAVLAIISPSQFMVLMDIISQSRDLIIVVLVIAVVAYILRKVERI
jgi:hypothetical protein